MSRAGESAQEGRKTEHNSPQNSQVDLDDSRIPDEPTPSSGGDIAQQSAEHEPSNPKSIPKPALLKNRSVSWGQNVEDNSRTATSSEPAATPFPPLNENETLHHEAVSPSPQFNIDIKSYSQEAKGSTSGVLGLRDIVDPLDLGAEVLISEALDAQDPTTAERMGPSVSVDDLAGMEILEGVPDDFVEGHDFAPRRKDSVSVLDGSVAGLSERRSRKDSISVLGGSSIADVSDRRQRDSQTDSISKTGTISTLRGALAKSRSRKPADKSDMETVEQKIFGAAEALDAMHRTSTNPSMLDEVSATGPILDLTTSDKAVDVVFRRRLSTLDVEGEGHSISDFNYTHQMAATDTRDDAKINTSNDDEENGEKGEKGKKPGPSSNKWFSDDSKIKREWDNFQTFFAPRKRTLWQSCRVAVLYVILPMFIVAVILYHGFENPSTGRGRCVDSATASGSWWLLFLIRQLITVGLAVLVQILIIDYVAIRKTLLLRSFGPLATLFIIQSRGWPFVLSVWSLIDFAILSGDLDFARHWLYFQDVWGLMNENNCAGNVTSSGRFTAVLTVSLVVGFVSSIKRLLVSLYLGRKSYLNYSEELAKTLSKMVLMIEVAALARRIEKERWDEGDSWWELSDSNLKHRRMVTLGDLAGLVSAAENDRVDDDMSLSAAGHSLGNMELIVEESPGGGPLTPVQKQRIRELLGGWKEPHRGVFGQNNDAPISAILQFRRSLIFMDSDFPFSRDFGIADTRETCIVSAQQVFERLGLETRSSNLMIPFETIAAVALDEDGELDTIKVKNLIKIFHPNADGTLSLIDFVRSVDDVYQELRLLRASIRNSRKIDKVLRRLIDGVFYVLVAIVVLSVIGYDPLAMFLSLSSVIVAFSFMVARAAGSYFEGLLFILLQKPYGIGDRINVSNSESEANLAGAQTFIVENVGMFHTSFILAATNERATISNGSLSRSRIINGGRSKNAILFFMLKFGVATPYKKIEYIKHAIERFIKARPREWKSLIGFRATSIQAELGYVEYCVVLGHRTSWQNMKVLLESKATLICFCHELMKQMGIRYIQPRRPIEMSLSNSSTAAPPTQDPSPSHQKSPSDDISSTTSLPVSAVAVSPNVASPKFDGAFSQTTFDYVAEVERMFGHK